MNMALAETTLLLAAKWHIIVQDIILINPDLHIGNTLGTRCQKCATDSVRESETYRASFQRRRNTHALIGII